MIALTEAKMSELVDEARSNLTRVRQWVRGAEHADAREIILLLGETNAIVATIMNRVALGELADVD